MQTSSISTRALELVRAGGVGLVATLVDLLALSLLINLAGVSPAVANVPALLAGAVIQFVGCRMFVFEANSGSLRDQLAGFALAETGTLALNALAFHVLAVLMHLPYGPARIAASLMVFLGFSMPMWRRVFANSDPEGPQAKG